MTETSLVRELHLHLGSLRDVRLFRNNVGAAWQGEEVARTPTTVTLKNPRRVVYGLCQGSSDLIGWRSLEITPDMVGQKIAVLVALEVKSMRGQAQTYQQNFLRAVNDAGGIGAVVRSQEDAHQALKLDDTPVTVKP